MAITVLLDNNDCGYRVFHSGESAIKALEDHYEPDIMIVDQRLAGGMRGNEFVREYHQRKLSKSPAILISGCLQSVPVDTRKDFHGELEKPFDGDDLIELINKTAATPATVS